MPSNSIQVKCQFGIFHSQTIHEVACYIQESVVRRLKLKYQTNQSLFRFMYEKKLRQWSDSTIQFMFSQLRIAQMHRLLSYCFIRYDRRNKRFVKGFKRTSKAVIQKLKKKKGYLNFRQRSYIYLSQRKSLLAPIIKYCAQYNKYSKHHFQQSMFDEFRKYQLAKGTHVLCLNYLSQPKYAEIFSKYMKFNRIRLVRKKYVGNLRRLVHTEIQQVNFFDFTQYHSYHPLIQQCFDLYDPTTSQATSQDSCQNQTEKQDEKEDKKDKKQDKKEDKKDKKQGKKDKKQNKKRKAEQKRNEKEQEEEQEEKMKKQSESEQNARQYQGDDQKGEEGEEDECIFDIVQTESKIQHGRYIDVRIKQKLNFFLDPINQYVQTKILGQITKMEQNGPRSVWIQIQDPRYIELKGKMLQRTCRYDDKIFNFCQVCSQQYVKMHQQCRRVTYKMPKEVKNNVFSKIGALSITCDPKNNYMYCFICQQYVRVSHQCHLRPMTNISIVLKPLQMKNLETNQTITFQNIFVDRKHLMHPCILSSYATCYQNLNLKSLPKFVKKGILHVDGKTSLRAMQIIKENVYFGPIGVDIIRSDMISYFPSINKLFTHPIANLPGFSIIPIQFFDYSAFIGISEDPNIEIVVGAFNGKLAIFCRAKRQIMATCDIFAA